MEWTVAQRKEAVRSGLGLVGGVGIGLVVAVAPLAFQRYLHIDPQLVATLGYPAVFLVNVLGSLALFLPVPGLAVVMFAGSVLDPALVALTAAAGMALGMTGPYILGATSGAALKRATAGKSNLALRAVARVCGWLNRSGVLASALLAAVPNPVFDFVGVLAGAARLPLWKFLLGTFLGKVAQCMAVAYAGAYFQTWLAGVWR